MSTFEQYSLSTSPPRTMGVASRLHWCYELAEEPTNQLVFFADKQLCQTFRALGYGINLSNSHTKEPVHYGVTAHAVSVYTRDLVLCTVSSLHFAGLQHVGWKGNLRVSILQLLHKNILWFYHFIKESVCPLSTETKKEGCCDLAFCGGLLLRAYSVVSLRRVQGQAVRHTQPEPWSAHRAGMCFAQWALGSPYRILVPNFQSFESEANRRAPDEKLNQVLHLPLPPTNPRPVAALARGDLESWCYCSMQTSKLAARTTRLSWSTSCFLLADAVHGGSRAAN